MFIDKDSVIVNNISMGQYITEAKFGYYKVWGKDTGRNLAYDLTGTLGGIFPKITLYFRKLTKAELNIISPILDSDSQIVTYYDPTKNSNITMTTHTGDWEVIDKNININEPFNCAFISNSKRS